MTCPIPIPTETERSRPISLDNWSLETLQKLPAPECDVIEQDLLEIYNNLGACDECGCVNHDDFTITQAGSFNVSNLSTAGDVALPPPNLDDRWIMSSSGGEIPVVYTNKYAPLVNIHFFPDKNIYHIIDTTEKYQTLKTPYPQCAVNYATLTSRKVAKAI